MDPIDKLQYLASQDPVLAEVIKVTGYPAYNNTHNIYEDVFSCLLDMRIHYTPTNAAFRYIRLKRMINDLPLDPRVWEQLPDEQKAELKLSKQKKAGIDAWTDAWTADLANYDWASAPDEEIIRKVAEIKWLSEWTGQMVLIFSLERDNQFPFGDYQLTKALEELYEPRDEKALNKLKKDLEDRWGRHQSLAVRCIWRWRERVKGYR